MARQISSYVTFGPQTSVRVGAFVVTAISLYHHILVGTGVADWE